MIINIKWGNLKDGFYGFEKLAFEYVKANYKNSTWAETPLTRDGNKDATAIFYGYKDDKFGEKWWMEAKYSDSHTKLSRYRLDATVVSAILEKNVRKVIFVTNMIVNTKTVYDIKNALYNAINCNDVSFCTKYTLEYWLSQNIDLYNHYFKTKCNENDTINRPELFIMQDIEYYSEVNHVFAFRESVKELYTNEKYIGYFSVFSSKKIKLPFKPNRNIKGITVIDQKYIDLLPGENPVNFEFMIDEYDYSINNEMQPLSFELGDTEVLSARFIIPRTRKKTILNLSSQRTLLGTLENKYKCFNTSKQPKYIFIEGISGSGKSFILESFIKDNIESQKEVFYAEFTDSAKSNIQILINIILFILFPYLNPSEIDYDYLKQIKNNFIGKDVMELIANKNDFDSISQLISKIHINDSILPMKLHVCERIIILDDLQKLPSYQAYFLSVIIADMQRHDAPVFSIMCAQPSYFYETSYLTLLEHCVTEHLNCFIGLNEIFDAIPSEKAPKFYLSPDITYSLEFNIIEILLLAKYILENEIVSKNIQEFIMTCKLFQRSAFLETYILKQFNIFFNKYPICREICDSIYWASKPPGLEKYEYNENEIFLLISNGFIKYNYDSCLVPVHDIYKLYYCRHFKNTHFNEKDYKEESPELIKYRLENEICSSLLSKEAQKIIELAEKQKFYTVSFVLQDIFETSKKLVLRNRIDYMTYYKLYYAYALSTTQQSISKTGYDIFLELGEEINSIDIPAILEISISINWELALGNYERLKYGDALYRLRLMIISLTKLCRIRNIKIQEAIRYHDVLMLDTLIRANQYKNVQKLYKKRISIMENYDFIYRSKGFQVRFALTLCDKNIIECLKMLRNCNKYFEENYGLEDKYSLWSAYHLNYFSMIYYNKPALINEVVKYHIKLKTNFYMNYRNRLNGMASYYYFIGEVTTGNKYLFLEASFNNELPGRQVAFQYETVALHEVLKQNIIEAKHALQKAIDLFEELPFYQNIPIHNLNILDKLDKCYKFEYWFGGRLKKDVYYIDSRCSW